MSLRTKVLSSITAALLLLFLAQYLLTRVVLFDSFAHLETERASINLQLIRSVIEQNLSQMQGITQDYAFWDETIALVKNESPDYLKENLNAQGFYNLRINSVIFVDAKGKLVAQRAYNWETKKEIPISQELLMLSTGNGPLWKHQDANSKYSGLIILPESPALVTSFPILNSDGEGPVYGALIWARYLDNTMLKTFQDTARMRIKLTSLEPPLTSENESIFNYLKDNPTHVQIQDNNTLIASAMLSDIFAKPALIYSTEITRDIYAQVVSTTGFLFWSTLAAFLTLALFSLLFDKLVIQRITKLTKYVSDVGNQKASALSRIPITGGNDELSNLAGSVNNMLSRIEQGIAERKSAEDRIYLMAHYDQLTRLPNRALLNNVMTKAIAEAQKTNSQFALLFMDLDRFKNVNDSIGHQAGDELLTIVADRLRAFIGGRAFIARLGGDEFVVLLPDLFDVGQAGEFAERLVNVLNRTCTIRGQDIHVSTSVGISVYPLDGEDIETLIRNADTAMYRAKDIGRNSFAFYNQRMNAAAVERLQIESYLRNAITRDELVMHYQPVADLVSNQMISAEALLRWNHAELGYIPPGKFVPIAEEAGLIHLLGNWVLNSVCNQLRRWLDANISVVPVAVNISAKQLQNKNFYQESMEILHEHGIPTSLIVLELTESAIMAEDEEILNLLQKLQAAGLRIAIDDFGTGYSSFSRLHQFPIDVLKIDQSFIRRINGEDSSESVIKAMINMAKALSIRVIAEGVETEQQAEILLKNQCDAIQGYLISKPLSAVEFGSQLRNQAHHGRMVSMSKPRTKPVSMSTTSSNGKHNLRQGSTTNTILHSPKNKETSQTLPISPAKKPTDVASKNG